jgi:hypothetical protein
MYTRDLLQHCACGGDRHWDDHESSPVSPEVFIQPRLATKLIATTMMNAVCVGKQRVR